MTTAIPGPVTAATDAERLDVFRVAVQANALAAALLPGEQRQRILRDQLERASLSVVLNVGEGAGRRSRKDKRRHYAIARGSAMECSAAMNVIAMRQLAPAGEIAELRALFVRAIQMLTKLDDALA